MNELIKNPINDKETYPNLGSNDGFDLVILVKVLWIGRKTILYSVAVFFILSLILALFTPNQYTSRTTFVQLESNGSSGSAGLSGLASLAGINIDSKSNQSLPPILYPKIAYSSSFKRKLLKSGIKPSGFNDSITFEQYYTEVWERPFFKRVTSLFNNSKATSLLENKHARVPYSEGIENLTPFEIENFERIENQMAINVNSKDGSIEISFTMPDPLISAQMVRAASNILQNEIVEFKINKAKQQLEFIEARYSEKKREYEQIQSKLASFLDSNLGMSTAQAKNELTRLEAEYDLALTVFRDLSQQMEKAYFDVKQDTPVLSVIQDVVVPYRKSAPRRSLYIIFGCFLGFGLGSIWVLSKRFLIHVKNVFER